MLSEPILGKYKPLLVSAVLVLLILVAFEPLRHNSFIDYDNERYLIDNPNIQSGFTWESVQWAFTSGYAANWHPLTWLSHIVDIELFGLNPLGHHLHNLFLHTISVVLLFWLLYKMTGSVWCSAFVAMVFGIHPLRVESVAWAAERKDVLCAMFWMLTMLAYLGYVRCGGRLRYLLIVLCFAIGLMGKPMLVTLPIILLIMDIWPLKRIHNNIGRLIVEKIPLFILVVISCIITYKVQQIAGSMANAESLPWPARLSNALISYLSYLGKIFWPVDLALFYPYPAQLPLWKPVASALILIAVSAFVIYRFYKQPWLTTGWLWYGVSLIPVIGIVQVGSQAMADRYTYLPSIGIAMMVSWTTAELSSKWPFKRVILGILSGMIAIAMIAGTRTQITYWKDNITLYEHTLGITENNAIIHNFLGQVLLKENKIDVAFEHIAKAVEIRPNYADAHTNMGMVLASRGNPEQAILAYEQAIKLNPRCVGAYTNLATLKAQQGSLDEAVEYLRRSIQIQPTPEAYFNLGFLLKTQGNSEESISCYRNALLFKPNDIQTLWQLACCLHETGDFSEAIKVYYQVIRIEPNFPEALSRVAWILAVVPDDKLQNPTQAILLAQKACQMTEFNDPIMLDTLAVAYASANRFKEAIETSQKAVDLARAAGQVEMVQEMEKNLKLYQSGKTYQAPPSGN